MKMKRRGWPGRSPAMTRAALERNLVVHVLASAGAREGRGPVEHGVLAVEALQHDLGRVLVLTGLVLPFARLQRAFEVNLGALLEVLLDDAAEVLVEDHHPVPFGALAPLAGRLVAPRVGGGDAQIDDRSSVLHAADLRVLSEVADQNHLVHAACHDRSPLKVRLLPLHCTLVSCLAAAVKDVGIIHSGRNVRFLFYHPFAPPARARLARNAPRKWAARAQVPRTRSSHNSCRESGCELRGQSGTRIIELLVSFDSEVRI